MTFSPLARRVAASVIGAGSVLLGLAAPAAAYPGPGCSSADIMAVESQITAAMAAYLFTHPDVNVFLSNAEGMPASQRASMINDYLAANPQTKAEVDAIRSPGAALRSRCNIPDSHVHLGLI